MCDLNAGPFAALTEQRQPGSHESVSSEFRGSASFSRGSVRLSRLLRSRFGSGSKDGADFAGAGGIIRESKGAMLAHFPGSA
jgi:hypothetical protein